MRRLFRLAVALAPLTLATLVLGLPRPASSHAIVVESSPVPDAVLTGPPARVILRFNSRIEKRLARITLAAGARVPVPVSITADGPDASKPDHLVVPLPPLAPGVYVLRYRVLAVDGHISEGALRFTVTAGQ